MKEAYRNATSDSSDEDYTETAGAKRRKSNAGKAIRICTNKIQDRNDRTDTMDGNQNHKENDHSVEGKSHKKLKVEGSNSISSESQKSTSEVGSSGKDAAKQYKRLGEAVVQVFPHDQYLHLALKELVLNELVFELCIAHYLHYVTKSLRQLHIKAKAHRSLSKEEPLEYGKRGEMKEMIHLSHAD